MNQHASASRRAVRTRFNCHPTIAAAHTFIASQNDEKHAHWLAAAEHIFQNSTNYATMFIGQSISFEQDKG
jgi:hypothetical protein